MEIEELKKEQCYGCSACINICPKKAISMKQDEKGFYYPHIDQNLCIHCGLCTKACPSIQRANKNEKLIRSYACKNKNDDIRMKSSSGGIFTLLAQYVLKQKGIVFGARWNKNFMVEHSFIEKEEDITLFRGSKYLQSNIKESYKQVKIFLEKGKIVLFTGTPCQISGLKTFLGKEYENLYTQDFICHGVPSPKFWKKYLTYKTPNDAEITNINFRDKEKYDWDNFSLAIDFNNKKRYNRINTKDFFMQVFLSDICLRDSCYACPYKNHKTLADITLADLWGAKEIIPSMYDNKGVSLAICYTKKGQELMDAINPYIEKQEISLEKVGKYNKSLLKPAVKPENREQFFIDLEKQDFKRIIKTYKKRFIGIKRFYRKCKGGVKKLILFR